MLKISLIYSYYFKYQNVQTELHTITCSHVLICWLEVAERSFLNHILIFLSDNRLKRLQISLSLCLFLSLSVCLSLCLFLSLKTPHSPSLLPTAKKRRRKKRKKRISPSSFFFLALFSAQKLQTRSSIHWPGPGAQTWLAGQRSNYTSPQLLHPPPPPSTPPPPPSTPPPPPSTHPHPPSTPPPHSLDIYNRAKRLPIVGERALWTPETGFHWVPCLLVCFIHYLRRQCGGWEAQ